MLEAYWWKPLVIFSILGILPKTEDAELIQIQAIQRDQIKHSLLPWSSWKALERRSSHLHTSLDTMAPHLSWKRQKALIRAAVPKDCKLQACKLQLNYVRPVQNLLKPSALRTRWKSSYPYHAAHKFENCVESSPCQKPAHRLPLVDLLKQGSFPSCRRRIAKHPRPSSQAYVGQ